MNENTSMYYEREEAVYMASMGFKTLIPNRRYHVLGIYHQHHHDNTVRKQTLHAEEYIHSFSRY